MLPISLFCNARNRIIVGTASIIHADIISGVVTGTSEVVSGVLFVERRYM